MLIDGHAIVFRAYHAMERQGLTNSSGLPVGATFAFYRMLAKLLQEHAPDYFLLIFDPPGKNFRHELYPEYKANRKEAPEDFKVQLQEILEIAEKMQIPMFIPKNAEADDAIASLVEKYKDSGIKISIVSSDKDLYPLLYNDISMLRPRRGSSEFQKVDADFVRTDLSVDFSQMVDFLAITGDSSDNIPGVKGVGPKGACKLLNEYKTLENIYEHIHEIQPEGIKNKLIESKDDAFLSQRLVRLKTDVPFDGSLEELMSHNFLKSEEADIEVLKRKELNVVYQDWLRLTDKKQIKREEIVKEFSIIRSKSEWDAIEPELMSAELVAVDTETTYSSPMRAKLLGVAFSWQDKKNGAYRNAYLPCIFEKLSDHEFKEASPDDLFDELKSIHSDYKDLLPGEEVLEWAKDFLESEQNKKTGQNIKYDRLVLRRHGVDARGFVSDTMLLSFLLKPNQRRHNLDDMALDHLGHTTIKYKDLVKGSTRKRKRGEEGTPEATLLLVELERVAEYSCEDSEVTLRLNHILEPLVQKQNLMKIFQEIDLPMAYTLMVVEENGILLDTDYLKSLSRRHEEKLNTTKEKIFEIAGERFNVQSTLELRRVLFEKLGIVSEKKTEKGQLSTDHGVLERLKHQHPIIPHLLEFRLISKLLSTYVAPLPQAVSEDTGRIHTSFSQVTASTGRLASMEPNLQNIPIKGEEGKAIRRAFIAPEGFELLSLDYSQIELRVLAHYSEDENLLKAYANDEDIHDQAAYLLFSRYFDDASKKWDIPSASDEEPDAPGADEPSIRGFEPERLNLMKETPEFQGLRAKAKILNFSIIYGVTEWGLSHQLGIPRSEAASLIAAYLANYPGIQKYMQESVQSTKEKGTSENLLGRKRLIGDLGHKNRFKREAAERLAINTPIQSTAADIVKIAMVAIQKEIEKNRLQAKMILQVHDELLFEVPVSEKNSVFEMVKSKMEGAVRLKVPLKVSGGFGKNWDEAK